MRLAKKVMAFALAAAMTVSMLTACGGGGGGGGTISIIPPWLMLAALVFATLVGLVLSLIHISASVHWQLIMKTPPGLTSWTIFMPMWM